MQPIIISKEEHGISLDQIDRHALYIIEKLRAAGHVAYLVGGSVRDLLLGHTPKDYDISTSAIPEEIKALFGRQCILIGRRFRLAHIRFGRKIIEVATFRAGDPETPEFITRDNIWGTPEEDVLRRDFTINGLFFDSFEETVIDYVGGYADAQKKQLKMIGEPYVRYRQDPVRMIRLVKFLARFNLEAEHDTRLACIECKADILKSSQARVLEELLRMLESGAAEHFFRLMTDYGLMQLLLPDVAEHLEELPGNEIYAYLQEVDRMQLESKEVIDRSVALSALIYPMLHNHLKIHYVDGGNIPHLGQIQSEAGAMIRKVFGPFFLLPRRISGKMLAILNGQYRMTPFVPKKSSKLRVPNVAEFSLALDFLSLRSRIDPELKAIFTDWEKAFSTVKIEPEKRSKPRRRRRRKA